MKTYINRPNITRCLPEKYFSLEFRAKGGGATALYAPASYAYGRLTERSVRNNQGPCGPLATARADKAAPIELYGYSNGRLRAAAKHRRADSTR